MTQSDAPRNWNANEFLKIIYRAMENGTTHDLRRDLSVFSIPTDMEAALSSLTSDAWDAVVAQEQGINGATKPARPFPIWINFLIGLVVLALLIGGFIWLPKLGGLMALNLVTQTPTQTTTATLTKTPSPTATLTPTSTPIPTLTPEKYLDSVYLLSDAASLSPAIPLYGTTAWVLNNEMVIPSMPFDQTDVWTQFGGSDGMESYYYTTSGGVSLTWQLDQPFDTGLYALYVLDTQRFSAGEQTYIVFLDGQEVRPYRGSGQVIFNHTLDQHAEDEWLLLGFYEAANGQTLSIQAEVTARSPDLPFAVDRLLVVKLPEDQCLIIDGLPSGRPLMSLLDDRRATFYEISGNPTRILNQGQVIENLASWNRSYLSRVESWVVPVQVDLASLGRLPSGKYELYVLTPPEHANVPVDYSLVADGQVLLRDNPALLNQKDWAGEWYQLGTWDLRAEAAVSVRMIIAANAQGEIGIDVVALVRVIE